MPVPILPKRLESALRVLLCLAQTRGHPIRAREVARCVRMPTAHAAKALYLLTWAGLVASRRGPRGGFWLLRSPERIRLRQLAKFFLTPSQKSSTNSHDPLLRAWQRTAGGDPGAWQNLTLADLVRRAGDDREISPYRCPETGRPLYAP